MIVMLMIVMLMMFAMFAVFVMLATRVLRGGLLRLLCRTALTVSNRSTRRRTDDATEDRAIPAAHIMTDGSAGSAAHCGTQHRTTLRVVGTCRQQ